MQEQNASKAAPRKARWSLGSIASVVVFSVLMLAAATTWLWPYRTLPTATWREADSALPWKHEGLAVQSVKGHWESASGNERMMLRTAWYPVAEVELGQFQGSGMLYITFSDERGRQAGDTINLYYNNGSFSPRTEVNIQAEGSTARTFIEAGYDKDSDFELHRLDESIPLWRINLLYRPEGAHNLTPLGSVTIPARLQQ